MYASLPTLTTENSLASYLKQIKQYPLLSQEEESTLAFRVFEHQDINAAHKLVTSHLRLVVKVAFKMRKYGVALLDLISEGNIGLMHAIKKFNPNLGYRLSTYAIWWIKASIQEFIIKSWSLVKIGTTVAQKRLFFNLNKLKTKIQQFNKESDQALSETEIETIANNLEVSKNDVKEMESRLGKGDSSLDSELLNADGQNSGSLINNIPSTADNQEVALANHEDLHNKKRLLAEALSTLNPREKDIIASRHLKSKADTLDTMSIKYKVSRERIRQIEARALEKIQEHCLAKQVV
ncbi:MAG: RNA polymerase factor sigma-32 [Rickettsiales bacterium]|nr:RNA polymerase factor sigma-32 [Rickettsiales bacterium]